MNMQNAVSQRTNLELLSSRRGQFDGYDIHGSELRAPDDVVSWNITMSNAESYANFWLTGGAFRAVGTHIFDPSANGGTTYEIGPVIEPSDAERKVVEAALKFWLEGPPDEDAPVTE